MTDIYVTPFRRRATAAPLKPAAFATLELRVGAAFRRRATAAPLKLVNRTPDVEFFGLSAVARRRPH